MKKITPVQVSSSLLIFICMAMALVSYAGAIQSNGTGLFSNPATWQGAAIPGATDTAVIIGSNVVTLDLATTLAGLRIMPSAKFDNNGRQLTLTSSGDVNYIVYGEHNITGNVFHPTTIGAFKMIGSSIGSGGLISGTGQLTIGVCGSLDSIVGNFTIPDANLMIGINDCACGAGSTIQNNGNIVMTSGSITITGGLRLINVGNISMAGGNIVLGSSDGICFGVIKYGFFNNSGNMLLSTGSILYQISSSIFTNDTKGVLTLQNGAIDMSSIAGTFNNNGITTITNNYILGGGSGLAYFNNNGGSRLNIGGSPGDPFFTGGAGRLVLSTTVINTVNYIGAGDQKIHTPYAHSPAVPKYWNLECSNNGNKTINGYNLVINGNLTIRDNAVLDASQDGGITNFNINLKGNWYDSSAAVQPFIPRNKKVIFTGNTRQSVYVKNHAETFYDLVINNSDTGVVLTGGNINISDTLTISDGLLHTALDTVWVSNSDTASIKKYSDSTYVNGYLKRSISALGGNYDFPIGNATAYSLANVHFFGTDTIGTLTVDFSNPSGGNAMNPLTDANDAVYDKLLNCGGAAPSIGNVNAGIWNIRPGKGSAIYDLSLYGRHYNNPGTMYHSIIKRKDSGSPWAFAGTYLAADLKTDTIIATRTCLTGFNQFAIARSNTSSPLNTTPISFSSLDSMICGSKCISFTSKNNFSATSWRWTRSSTAFSANADSALQNPSGICFNTLGNYDVRLIASTACTADTLEKNTYIKVNPIPTVTITSPDSICSGVNAVLSASSTGTGVSYLWNNITTTATISVSPITTTTFSVVASTAFCGDTAYTSIAVTTTPTAAINANTTAICSGERVFLTGTGAANAYLWNTGATGTAITASPMSTESYTLTINNGKCFDKHVLTINVTTTPTAVITGETSICSGKRAVFSAMSVIPGLTYLWNTNATSQGINATPLTSTTYSVVVFNGNCKDTAMLDVTVTSTPTLTLTSNKTILCGGESVTLSASASGGGAGIYSWSNGKSSNAITANPTTSQRYVLTLSNGNCFDSDSLLITVVPMPTASISGSSTVCSGNNTSLTAMGGSTYLWSSGETNADINITPLINTAYSVTVSNGNGLCTDTTSKSITLIAPVPADAGPDITIAIGLDTVLSASNGTAWNWYPKVRLDCNTCQSTIVAPFQTTSYTVTVTDINGCLSSDSVKVYVIPCADLFVPKAFSPNNDGQNDVLYIRGTDCIDKINAFTIFNRWGEKVFETTDIKAGWDGSQSRQTKSNEVFIYFLDALSINGDAITKTGNVTLMK